MAREALRELEGAGQELAAATGARDRVAALTRVVGAYETGLAALREGLRRAAIEEAALTRRLDAESVRVAQVLAALETMERTPESTLLLHPLGPLGAVRSGMLLAEAVPQVQAEVAALRSRLEELRRLRALQQAALAALEGGLRSVQDARSALSAAISERIDLPQRVADDDAAVARLKENAATLEDFALGLAAIGLSGGPGGSLPEAASPGLPLPLPVNGRVIRQFSERDAAGIARPGILIATAPLALVTTPVPATIRYLGPLLDYGNVMILEPDPGTLLVLAGLKQVYGASGQVIPAGTPVGLMGGEAPTATEFVAESLDGTGADRSETLYLELRKGDRPVDPAEWFAGTKDASE
jgi:septal ring factor EnvC (AmiA/AmiB activator)